MRISFRTWCVENDAKYLLEEWNTEENGEIDEKLSYGSEKRVSWKCNKGHVWGASLNQRTSTKSMCPYCSGRYAIPYETDLATLYPDIVKEWIYEKNTKNPINVKPSSHDKVWWKCKKCGHEWKAVISSRTHGYGCPECGKKSVSKARRRPSIGGSLIELYPEVAISWNHERNGGLQCDEIAAYSGQMVWWKCKEGHEWKASVSNRVKGRNCPYCSNKKIIAGYNDFATRYPELAKEWNNEKNMELRPTQFAPSSSKKVWWKCIVCGHEWTTSINNRVKRGCPNCSKARTVSFPEKVIFYYMKKIFCEVIENYRPDFLEGRELDIFIPDINLAIEYDGTLYHQNVEKDVYKQNRCQENNILLIRIREPGCPALANSQYVIELSARDMTAYENMITDIIKILSSEKILHDISLDINLQRDSAEIKQLINYQSVDDSIFSTNPELIDYWDSLKNKDFAMNKVTHSSDKEVWWKCPKCKYEWFGKVYSMTRKKGRKLCPKCTAYEKSIINTNPRLAKYWNDERNNNISILQVSHASTKEVWWKCPHCQYEWKRKVYEISDKRRKSICPQCKIKNEN